MYKAEHRLFNTILESVCHVLEQLLLPSAIPLSYDFRKRPHRHIPNRSSYLTDCNFLIRMMCAGSYWFRHCCILSFYAAICLYSLTTSMFII